MPKKLKKHGYAERLKYMHMLENGYSKDSKDGKVKKGIPMSDDFFR